jgi:hypothetical protein
MGYGWVEHTGEVELEIEASTVKGVFGEALHALAELIGIGAGGKVVSLGSWSPAANRRRCSSVAWRARAPRRA